MCFPLVTLFLFGLGALEIKFPGALSLSTFDDNYTGAGWAGLVVLVFEIILVATWGKVSGIILIFSGIFLMGVWIMDCSQSKLESIDSKKDNISVNLPIKVLAAKSAFWGYKKYRSK